MFTTDFLNAFDYEGNKGLKWIYDNVFDKYNALITKASYDVKVDYEEITNLFVLCKYCELIVNDFNNPYLSDKSLETFTVKWNFDKFKICFDNHGLNFNDWLTAVGFMNVLIPEVAIHASYLGYFNYQPPITPVDNTYNVVVQGTIGIYLLDIL